MDHRLADDRILALEMAVRAILTAVAGPGSTVGGGNKAANAARDAAIREATERQRTDTNVGEHLVASVEAIFAAVPSDKLRTG